MTISTDKLVRALKGLKDGSRSDQMYYLAWLKKFIQVGKYAYALQPDEQFKQDLVRLAKHVEDFEPRSNWYSVKEIIEG